MAHRGRIWRVLLAAAAVGSLLAWPSTGQAAGFGVRRQVDLLPGVQVQGLSGSGLSLDVGRVARGAPVHVEVVTASDGITGPVSRLETTTAACRRVGGIVCINGDFTELGTSSPVGGVIHDSVLQRSPIPAQPQLKLNGTVADAGPLTWGTTLEVTATYLTQQAGGALPPKARVEKATLSVNAVNRPRQANQVVLYTPKWAGNTTTGRGGDEAVLSGGQLALGTDVPVTVGPLRAGAGSTPIPGNGMVLSAEGQGQARLRAFLAAATKPGAAQRSVVVRPRVDKPLQESVGGYYQVLANGQTQNAGDRDPFATGRNPRTLVGWTGAGDLLLVTVDGRQPGYSRGVSLPEAADVLRQVGATSGFNLDGGGSSTFVSLPPGSRTPRVLNRPSDGSERRLTTFLAVVPNDPAAVRTPPPGPAPAPAPPAATGPPPPDPASTRNLPNSPPPSAAAAPTTVPAPTLPETPMDLPPATEPEISPVPDPDGAGSALTQRASPRVPANPSTGPAAAIAAIALAAAAIATARQARRTLRG